MRLEFLKKTKWPRVAKPMEEKAYGLSSSESLDDQCVSELMDACASKDVDKFKSALEALVMNMFEDEESHGA